MLRKKFLITSLLFSFASWLFLIGYVLNDKFHEWIGVFVGVSMSIALILYFLWKIKDNAIKVISIRFLYITCVVTFALNTAVGCLLYYMFDPTPTFDLAFVQLPMPWLLLLASIILFIYVAAASYVNIDGEKR